MLRAGYGRFFQLFERYGSEDQLALNPPFLLNAAESTSSRTAPVFVLQDGFPAKYRSSETPQADRIADGRLDGGERTIDRWFDASAFRAPKTPAGLATFGNAGRGILIGPSLTNFDFSLARNFNLIERLRMEFRWETFNLANTPQFGLPATNISSPGNVGQITTLAGDPRVMQFALKLIF